MLHPKFEVATAVPSPYVTYRRWTPWSLWVHFVGTWEMPASRGGQVLHRPFHARQNLGLERFQCNSCAWALNCCSKSTPNNPLSSLHKVNYITENIFCIIFLAEMLLKMQADLITEEYRLQHEECGEGSSRRIKILHTYIGS